MECCTSREPSLMRAYFAAVVEPDELPDETGVSRDVPEGAADETGVSWDVPEGAAPAPPPLTPHTPSLIALQFKQQSDDFSAQLAQLQKRLHALNADFLELQKVSPQAKLSCHSGRKDHHIAVAEDNSLSDHVATRFSEQDEKMQALRTAAKSMTLSTGPHESLDGDHIDNSQQHGKYSNSAVAVLLRFDDDFQLLKDRMVKIEERMEAVVTITVMEAAVRGLGLCVMEGAVRIKDIQERLTAFEDLSMAAMREEHDAVKIEHEDQHSLHKAAADVTEEESNKTVHRLGKIMQADNIFKMRPRLKTPRGKAATSSGVAVA